MITRKVLSPYQRIIQRNIKRLTCVWIKWENGSLPFEKEMIKSSHTINKRQTCLALGCLYNPRFHNSQHSCCSNLAKGAMNGVTQSPTVKEQRNTGRVFISADPNEIDLEIASGVLLAP
jgi:hypothetical protein